MKYHFNIVRRTNKTKEKIQVCKIYGLTNMENVVIDRKFIDAVKQAVCKTDKDGFGYSVLTHDGDLWGEKTTKPINFTPLTHYGTNLKLDTLPFVEKSSEAFGTLRTGRAKSFIGHGRISTNSVSLSNTHPFVNDKFALIHNGVVSDAGRMLGKLSTDCDTEIIQKYWEMGGIVDVEENVSGYYACAILDKSGNMYVFRDDMAPLYITWCETVQSWMYATTVEILQMVSKKMKWKIETPRLINDNTYIVFDGNVVVSAQRIEPLGRWSGMSAQSVQQSLGHTETDPNEDDVPSYKESEYGGAYGIDESTGCIIDDTEESEIEGVDTQLLNQYSNRYLMSKRHKRSG